MRPKLITAARNSGSGAIPISASFQFIQRIMPTVPMIVNESEMIVSRPWTTMSSTVLTSFETRDMMSPLRRASKKLSDWRRRCR